MRDKADPWERVEYLLRRIERYGPPTHERFGWTWGIPEDQHEMLGLTHATLRLAWAGFWGDVFTTKAAVEILKCIGFSDADTGNARTYFEQMEEIAQGLAYASYIAIAEVYGAFSGVFPHEKATDKALSEFDTFIQSYKDLTSQCPAVAFKTDMENAIPLLETYRAQFATTVQETKRIREYLSGSATPHDLRWAVALKCLAPIIDPALKLGASPGRGQLLHFCKSVIHAQFGETIDDANLRRIRRDMPSELTNFSTG